jgi:hypothetical protein
MLKGLLIFLFVGVGCATVTRPICPKHGKKPFDGVAAVATPGRCCCPKGYDCGDCCGPDHCVCNPN